MCRFEHDGHLNSTSPHSIPLTVHPYSMANFVASRINAGPVEFTIVTSGTSFEHFLHLTTDFYFLFEKPYYKSAHESRTGIRKTILCRISSLRHYRAQMPRRSILFHQAQEIRTSNEQIFRPFLPHSNHGGNGKCPMKRIDSE